LGSDSNHKVKREKTWLSTEYCPAPPQNRIHATTTTKTTTTTTKTIKTTKTTKTR
jgi:hypothetical protein